jgi:hypothetical protein
MKNTILKIIGGTLLAILMLAAFIHISVSAQQDVINNDKGDGQKQAEDLAARRENARKLEGSTIQGCG